MTGNQAGKCGSLVGWAPALNWAVTVKRAHLQAIKPAELCKMTRLGVASPWQILCALSEDAGLVNSSYFTRSMVIVARKMQDSRHKNAHLPL